MFRRGKGGSEKIQSVEFKGLGSWQCGASGFDVFWYILFAYRNFLFLYIKIFSCAKNLNI